MLKKMALDRVLYIYYPVQLRNDKDKEIIWSLINLRSEINTITFAYAAKLDFKIQKAKFDVQKINRLSLKTYKMV